MESGATYRTQSEPLRGSSSLAAEILQADLSNKQCTDRLRAKYGEGAVRTAQINRYLVETTGLPPPLPHPPTIFISYRWESDEARAWVLQLGENLRASGVRVILDQWEARQGERVDIPKLVSTLGHCNMVIPVITPAFNDAVKLSQSEPGWVFYEFQVARLLSWHGRLMVHGILREGTRTPEPWSRWPLLDLTSKTGRLAEHIGAHFSYRGPVVEADSVAERAWQESWKLLGAELYGDAERTLEQAVAKFPAIISFWSHLAFCRMQQGKGPEADSALDAALKLDTHDQFTLGLMAERAYAKRDSLRARVLCNKLLERDPFDFTAHFVLGNMLDDDRLFLEAKRHLDIALARRPTSPGILNNAGFVRLHMHDYAEAIRFFDRIPETSSFHPLAQLNKADALRLSGDLDGARSLCEALIARYPNFKRLRASARQTRSLSARWRPAGS